MNKSELKKILKPIVKECIRESLYESGVLSSIISEVVQGVVGGTNNQVLEQRAPAPTPAPVVENREVEEARAQQKLQELKNTKDRLLSAIGQSGYNGVNVFEGTEPLKSGGSPAAGPTPGGDRDPNDPGINIDALTNNLGGVWKKLAEGRKKQIMSVSVEARRGESSEALVRRFLRKERKANAKAERMDPRNGCVSCRTISKKSLKKRHKKIEAEKRRRKEEWRKLKRQRKREASFRR